MHTHTYSTFQGRLRWFSQTALVLLFTIPISTLAAPNGAQLSSCDSYCRRNGTISVDLNDDGAPDILAGDTNERLRILSLTPSGPQLWKTISGGA